MSSHYIKKYENLIDLSRKVLYIKNYEIIIKIIFHFVNKLIRNT